MKPHNTAELDESMKSKPINTNPFVQIGKLKGMVSVNPKPIEVVELEVVKTSETLVADEVMETGHVTDQQCEVTPTPTAAPTTSDGPSSAGSRQQTIKSDVEPPNGESAVKTIYLDTETLGLNGIPFMIQSAAEGDADVEIFHVFDHTPAEVSELLDKL